MFGGFLCNSSDLRAAESMGGSLFKTKIKDEELRRDSDEFDVSVSPT